MGESVAVAKEVDAEKSSSPTRSSSKSIHRVQKEHEMQLGSLGGVIGNIRSNGGTPSADGIATQLSGMHIAQRAPALLALQHTHGNRYVQRVVAGIQAKLVVGQPGDKYEQEADRVADEVMRMPEPRVQRQVEEEEEDLIQTKPLVNQITPFVQRQVEEEEEILQTKKREGTTPEVTHDLESSINALKGGGQPLAESTRNFFEPRFGYNFSDVRVHTDAKAGESAQAVNALAFTMGRDIVFGMGEYALETSGGLRLLAHELTHVQQQTGKNQSKIIQASPGNEKLNIGDTENETNALIKNASDVIERGGGVAKFEYLPPTWSGSRLLYGSMTLMYRSSIVIFSRNGSELRGMKVLTLPRI